MATKSKRSAKLERELCEWIATGQTLRAWCRQEGRPHFTRIYAWMEADSDFASRVARAREIGADAIAEQTLEIVDEPVERVATAHGTARDSAHVADKKLRAWHRMQLLAKWQPKKYGERLTHTGDPDSPIETRTIVETVSRGIKPADSGLPGQGAGCADPGDSAKR